MGHQQNCDFIESVRFNKQQNISAHPNDEYINSTIVDHLYDGSLNKIKYLNHTTKIPYIRVY